MQLIIDANILFSFFKSESTVRELVINSDGLGIKLIAPRLLMHELDKHKAEISKKAGISLKEYEMPRDAIETFVKFVPNEFWLDKLDDALKLLPEHTKDAPYIAMALKLSCAIWSNDKALKRQFSIKVYSTTELLHFFKI